LNQPIPGPIETPAKPSESSPAPTSDDSNNAFRS
jgi:hypothetical protein